MVPSTLYLMQARVDWVLLIFGTQAKKKKRPVRAVFPGYLSVSYDYSETEPQCAKNIGLKDIAQSRSVELISPG